MTESETSVGCSFTLPFSMSSMLPITLPISLKPDIFLHSKRDFDFVIDFGPEVVRLSCDSDEKSRGRLDLAVPFTPSTPNRQNRNQVCWNICAGVRWSTPCSEVV